MDPPAEIAGIVVSAVTAAEYPETAAGLILDAVIVPDRPGLGVATPPFAVDPLGSIAGNDLVSFPSPLEASRGLVGQQRDDAP